MFFGLFKNKQTAPKPPAFTTHIVWPEPPPFDVYVMTGSVDGRDVALANGFFTKTEFHLIRIDVVAEYRGRGYGSRMIAELLEEARRHKMPLVLIGVAKANADAIRLYQRLGATPRPTTPPSDKEDYVLA